MERPHGLTATHSGQLVTDLEILLKA